MPPRKKSRFAKRMDRLEVSGIRKIFDLAGSISNPVNFSLGQPDFPVPEPVQEAAIRAIRSGKNGYTVTQGLPELKDKIQAEIRRRAGFTEGGILVTSGVAGALFLAMGVLVEKGDEVIIPDPYFVLYRNIVRFFAGVPVLLDTYPDFRIRPERLERLITPRTKLVLFNNPVNPTGVAYRKEEVAAIAEVARRHRVLVVSDEIYASYSYDFPHESMRLHTDDTVLVGGFGKAYGITGWRLGFAAGPADIIERMTMLQQFSFVCAPSIAQWAGVAALDVKVSDHRADYRRRRDWVYSELKGLYEVEKPQGAFYFFPRCPRGLKDRAFVEQAIREKLLIVPGSACSQHATHFRMSYAVSDRQLERGVKILRQLARS
ncbi:MAG TPA: aminotransferase class I/II-fold pyridoxal phosphate-dependent enzyme [Planctomycetota bacterium]|nr:aminotransferase class I/II-fold pyridoxal phosphate-dependent enzyme [Planctomycetota bacterium]